jgi:hypothetical protein
MEARPTSFWRRQGSDLHLCDRRCTIQGWNPGVNLNQTILKVDNSHVPDAANSAVYKGATISEIGGQKFILAANFRSGKIDVFNTNFQQVHLPQPHPAKTETGKVETLLTTPTKSAAALPHSTSRGSVRMSTSLMPSRTPPGTIRWLAQACGLWTPSTRTAH